MSAAIKQVVDVYRPLREIDPQELDRYIADLEDELATAKLLRQAQEIIARRVKADGYVTATDLSRQEAAERDAIAVTVHPIGGLEPRQPQNRDALRRHLVRTLNASSRSLAELQVFLDCPADELQAALNDETMFECSGGIWYALSSFQRRERRRERLVALLRQNGPMTAEALGQAFDCSDGRAIGTLLQRDRQFFRQPSGLWSLASVPTTKTDSAA